MTFVPVPLAVVVRRLIRDAAEGRLLGESPEGWWLPAGPSLAVTLFGRRAGNPFGPAAGPHTQLAPNLVRAWLAGGRVLELKTVQAHASAGIPRPSIRLADAGYNVEHAQELSPPEALSEYAKAAALVAILDREDGFGLLASAAGRETVFDASVGYDLAGIRSEPMAAYLRALRDPEAAFRALRAELTGPLARYRDHLPEGPLAETVTLSTFHGCPPTEIERIVLHLMEERGFNVVLKLNPTLLGKARVAELLHDTLGYRHLELRSEAFARDLAYAEAVPLLERLARAARGAGVGFGVKLTNTLVVGCDPELFPSANDGTMYLSGAPLHVLAMDLLVKLGRDTGPDLPISFSAGVDARNAADAVACGLLPVTSCTDLLRPPGYPRLARQVRALEAEMTTLGATSLPAFVLSKALGAGEAPRYLGHLTGDTRVIRAAGLAYAEARLPRLLEDARYRHRVPAHAPARKPGLAVWNCRNCDLCVEVCPNGALLTFRETSTGVPRRQIAVVDDLCNDCGHCTPICPDGGAPNEVKTRLFRSRQAFETPPLRDGILQDGGGLVARRGGALVDVRDPAVASDFRIVRAAFRGEGFFEPRAPGEAP